MQLSKQISAASNWPIWPLHSLHRNLSRLHVEMIWRIFHPACEGPGGAIIIFMHHSGHIFPTSYSYTPSYQVSITHVLKKHKYPWMRCTCWNQCKKKKHNFCHIIFKWGKQQTSTSITIILHKLDLEKKSFTHVSPYFTLWILWKIQRPSQAVTWAHLVKETQNRHLLRPRTCDATYSGRGRTQIHLYTLCI